MNNQSQRAYNFEKYIPQFNEHQYISTEHLIFSLIKKSSLTKMLKKIGCNLCALKKELNLEILKFKSLETTNIGLIKPQITEECQRILGRAALKSAFMGSIKHDELFIFLATLSEPKLKICKILLNNNISTEKIHNLIYNKNTLKYSLKINKDDPTTKYHINESNPNHCLINMMDKAKLENENVLYGRENELREIILQLNKKNRNHSLIIGEPGTGKSTLIKSLISQIITNKVPPSLSELPIYSLDINSLISDTKYRGEFESKLRRSLLYLESLGQTILIIEDIHNMCGMGKSEGSSLDASNMLKSHLSNNKIKVIGTTSFVNFRKKIEVNPGFNQYFHNIVLSDLSKESISKILAIKIKEFEEHHCLTYSPEVLTTTIALCCQYFSNQPLLSVAIDILDEAGSYCRSFENKRFVKHCHIEKIISKRANVKIIQNRINKNDDLKSLSKNLKSIIFGQDNAIETLVNAIKISRCGLRDKNKNIGSFLFAGPTGVGKTELANQLSENLTMKLLRFDMSEYMEKHSVSKLIGSPRGYAGSDEGGLLTEAVSKHPRCILLLDEVEKSNSEILNLLLQVMDYGKLTDSSGRQVDFTKTILIMTSNAGSKIMFRNNIGFSSSKSLQINHQEINQFFSNEFRNRLDALIQFSPLTKHHMHKIVSKNITNLSQMLLTKKIHLSLTNDSFNWLVNNGFNQQFGARPLARLIDKKIKVALSDHILFGKLVNGGIAKLETRNDELYVSVN